MPGMMDTILDLGINDETAAGLATVAGDAFVRDCRGRFETTFRKVVGVPDVPDDPWQQLRLAIEAVFRSWDSDRARAYRREERIPDDLGTAVTIQAMVFGNLDQASATGVVFTRNPATGEPGLYGDVLFNAQGEDVVAGTHRTQPVSTLDERLPDVAASLRGYANRLEHHYADLCDIEFTIERGRLWMLQVRVGKRSPRAALRIAVDMAEDPSFPLSRREAVERVTPQLENPPTTVIDRDRDLTALTTGLGASPGVATGEVATSPEAAVTARASGRRALLVRAETSPEDVHGMASAVGILTARGGLASHAAVVARGWGIPAVVGATELEIDPGRVLVGGRTLREGDVITIDGETGEVFEGSVPSATEVVPEAATLLAWAGELGIVVGGESPTAPVEESPAGRPVDPSRVLASLAVKGFASIDGLASSMLTAPDDVRPVVDALVADGLIASSADSFKLSATGRVRADELLRAERERWGEEPAATALDNFLEIDQRVKDVVTAWQMRDPQTINDHADVAYDAGVLQRLAAVHRDALSWLRTAGSQLPRLADYGDRLGRAVAAAKAGDGRFVASPRVDSYHGIWFELHEDLIRLAGRTREGEAAAGRA
jgi:pyruvate,orthophosphate dikinase